MNTKLVEDIASAVLYEGYLLYPYRASAIKNQQRWNFGVLYPRAYAEQQSGADAWGSQTECLVRATSERKLSVRVRFLQLSAPGDSQAAQERDIALCSLRLSRTGIGTKPAHLSALSRVEAADRSGRRVASTTACTKSESPSPTLPSFSGSTRDDALIQSLISTHTILSIARRRIRFAARSTR